MRFDAPTVSPRPRSDRAETAGPTTRRTASASSATDAGTTFADPSVTIDPAPIPPLHAGLQILFRGHGPGIEVISANFSVSSMSTSRSPLSFTSVPAGIAAGQLGADPRQLGLDGSRFDYLDHRAPAGEVPGDVQRGRCGEADPGTPVAGLAVGVAVPAELGSQGRHEPGLDEHGRPGACTPMLYLADDLLPRGSEREVVRALGGLAGRLGPDDPVDSEGSLPSLGPGEQVPDVVLIDQTPRVDQPFGQLSGAVGVGQATFRRRITAACSRSTSSGLRRSRSPHRVGSIIVALAAASASARKVCGSARTSLRSAALASPETAAAGPTSRNSACASVADRPLRSVRRHRRATSRHRVRAAGMPGCLLRTAPPDRGERLVSMGATVHEKPVERGPGFVTASVVDPFGNILGVMYNQHYLEILGSQAGM